MVDILLPSRLMPPMPANRDAEATLPPYRRVHVRRSRRTPRPTAGRAQTLRAIMAVAVVAVAALLGYGGLRAWRTEGSVRDPRYLEFVPSPDHDALDSKARPIVQRYVLEVYAQDG